MKRILIISASFAIATLSAQAQNYIDHLQEQRAGQGTVQVIQSKAISELVNGTAPQQHTVANVATTSRNAEKSAPSQKPTEPSHKTTDTATTPHKAESTTTAQPETTIDTRRKVMRGQKVQGYRVQVYSGGNSRDDKNKAQRIGNAMKEAFPTQPVYVHFYSPRWVCRIGNFVDREDANECLKQVRALGYSQACIVKGVITVK